MASLGNCLALAMMYENMERTKEPYFKVNFSSCASKGFKSLSCIDINNTKHSC